MPAPHANTSRTTLRLSAANSADIAHAAGILRAGGLVAMPTETVYGLAANALDTAAIEGIFTAKQRPHWDPLIVHIHSIEALKTIVRQIPSDAHTLIRAFWPGPLTLLLPRSAAIPDAVTAGRDLVGVRMPSHPAALALLKEAALPLAAPSANRFGHISPTTAQHVLDDLDGRIDAVLEAGPCDVGVESTVFDPTARILYRQGGVSRTQIEAALNRPIAVFEPPIQQQAPESLPSPGVGIRHYAPRARMILVATEQALQQQARQHNTNTTGILLPTDWSISTRSAMILPWAPWNNAAALAHTLYDKLRELDATGVTHILCPLPASSDEPLVEALRDRLQKASR